MDPRLSFNQDPEGYERFRPTYTKALFDDVIAYSALDASKAALEIGIGTGQATLPFLKTGCMLTAVEIGDQLAAFSRNKFSALSNLVVLCHDFESVPLEDNSFDLAYSATAFHWIPPEIGLPKVLHVLRPGGAFAWISNQPLPADEDVKTHEAIQAVYNRYESHFGPAKPVLDPETKRREAQQKLQRREELMRAYGFTGLTSKAYEGRRTFTAHDYTALLSTYSDHKSLPDAQRDAFMAEIEDAIDENGGQFTLADSMLVTMGRKPA